MKLRTWEERNETNDSHRHNYNGIHYMNRESQDLAEPRQFFVILQQGNRNDAESKAGSMNPSIVEKRRQKA